MSAITRQPLAVEMLATEDQRRLREATATNLPLPASMSEDCADCWEKLPGPARMRKAKETERLLNLLDSLETGKDGPR